MRLLCSVRIPLTPPPAFRDLFKPWGAPSLLPRSLGVKGLDVDPIGVYSQVDTRTVPSKPASPLHRHVLLVSKSHHSQWGFLSLERVAKSVALTALP